MHKSKTALEDNVFILYLHQSHIEQLVNLFNDTDQDFEMSDYQHKATIRNLERAYDVISLRIKTLESAIENYNPDPRNEAHYFGDR